MDVIFPVVKTTIIPRASGQVEWKAGMITASSGMRDINEKTSVAGLLLWRVLDHHHRLAVDKPSTGTDVVTRMKLVNEGEKVWAITILFPLATTSSTTEGTKMVGNIGLLPQHTSTTRVALTIGDSTDGMIIMISTTRVEARRREHTTTDIKDATHLRITPTVDNVGATSGKIVHITEATIVANFGINSVVIGTGGVHRMSVIETVAIGMRTENEMLLEADQWRLKWKDPLRVHVVVTVEAIIPRTSPSPL